MFEKQSDRRFLDDMAPLLTTGTNWDYQAAARYVLQSLASLMPGDEWQKTNEQMTFLKQ